MDTRASWLYASWAIPTPNAWLASEGRALAYGKLSALAVSLCSDEASQITGAALPIDDGWTAH